MPPVHISQVRWVLRSDRRTAETTLLTGVLVIIDAGHPRKSHTKKKKSLGLQEEKHQIRYFAYHFRLLIRNTNNKYAYH